MQIVEKSSELEVGFKILMRSIFSPLTGNIDSNKSSITNGICCSTNSKYSKPGRKNSNLSQKDFDKKPLNNINSNNNAEHFDGIDQIIAENANTGTLKPKKSERSKSKDRKKLHGSLPNHLDTDVDYEGSDDTNSSGKLILHNYLLSSQNAIDARLSIKAFIDDQTRYSKALKLQFPDISLNCLMESVFSFIST